MTNRTGSSYRIQVLGPVAVSGRGGTIDLGGAKPRLVLALLIAGADQDVSSDRLVDGLWGDEPPPTCRKSLQVHVSRLRHALGTDFPIDTTRVGYRLRTDTGISIDAVAFERTVRQAEAIRAIDPERAATELAEALGRWRGPAYCDLADEPAIRSEAARLDALRLHATERRFEADLSLGRHGAVLAELETLTAQHPYHEGFRALHMLALYRAGRQADALRVFEQTRFTLAEDLGLEPGRDLRELQRSVLDQAPELDLPPADDAPKVVGSTRSAAVRAIDVGTTVNGYELRERLGVRAGTTVFRAYQPSIDREVALRVIAPATECEAFVQRFEQGCRLLARLEHPHIVSVHDFWSDDCQAFLTMQLMQGGTLAQSSRRRAWSSRAALRMIDQVGSALAHAHRRGIVHGDLRPSNVLLDESGNAFVSDFVLDESDRPIAPPDATFHAPELHAGRSPGPATDVYALGAIASMLLLDRTPGQLTDFDGASDVQRDLARVLRRATDPDAGARVDDVDELLRGLRETAGAAALGSAQ